MAATTKDVMHLQDAALVDSQGDVDALGQAPESQNEEVANQRRALVYELRGTLHHTAPTQRTLIKHNQRGQRSLLFSVLHTL